MEKLAIFNDCLKDITVPALKYTCPTDSKEAYSRCVFKREHLLDACINLITFKNFSPELATCGPRRLLCTLEEMAANSTEGQVLFFNARRLGKGYQVCNARHS